MSKTQKHISTKELLNSLYLMSLKYSTSCDACMYNRLQTLTNCKLHFHLDDIVRLYFQLH